MKYIKQFLVILVFTFLGEILKEFIPLPVPASIYGMLLLFAALLTGVVRLDAVRETGKFLIEIMPLMFIPAGVGLLDSWQVLKPLLVPIMVITLVSTITVFGASGCAAQFLIRADRKKGAKKDE